MLVIFTFLVKLLTLSKLRLLELLEVLNLQIHLDLYGSAFENLNEYICCLRHIASTVRKYSMEYIYMAVY